MNAGMVDDEDLAEAEGMGEVKVACHGAQAKGSDLNVASHEGVEADPIAVGQIHPSLLC